MHTWPDRIKQCKKEGQPYFSHWTDLTLFHSLILKEECIVVPAQLQTNILEKIYAGHQGQEKCKRWVRVSIFWLGINKDIERIIQDCNLCMIYRDAQLKQPPISHQIPTQSWQKVAVDLCRYNNKDYLIIVDSHSNYQDLYQNKQVKQ